MLALLLAGAFSFDGGKPVDFVAALSAATSQSVVLMAEPGSAIKPVNIRFERPDELPHRVAVASGLLAPDLDELVFCMPAYPEWLLVNGAKIDSEKIPSIELEVARGRVSTVDFKKGVIRPDDLARKFSKPVQVHWFYGKVPVYAQFLRERPSLVVSDVAKAVGSTFFEGPKEFRLGFAPSEFRRRAMAAYRGMGKEDKFPCTVQDAEFAVAALKLASDDELTKAYEAQGSSVTVSMRVGSEIFKLAVARLQRDYEQEINGGEQSASTAAAYRWIQANVDFSRPGKVLIRPGFRIAAMLRCKGEGEHWFAY